MTEAHLWNRIRKLEYDNEQAAARIEQLEAALRDMVYETTHLSAAEDDGSHRCRISKDTLAQARAALDQSPPPRDDRTALPESP